MQKLTQVRLPSSWTELPSERQPWDGNRLRNTYSWGVKGARGCNAESRDNQVNLLALNPCHSTFTVPCFVAIALSKAIAVCENGTPLAIDEVHQSHSTIAVAWLVADMEAKKG